MNLDKEKGTPTEDKSTEAKDSATKVDPTKDKATDAATPKEETKQDKAAAEKDAQNLQRER